MIHLQFQQAKCVLGVGILVSDLITLSPDLDKFLSAKRLFR